MFILTGEVHEKSLNSPGRVLEFHFIELLVTEQDHWSFSRCSPGPLLSERRISSWSAVNWALSVTTLSVFIKLRHCHWNCPSHCLTHHLQTSRLSYSSCRAQCWTAFDSVLRTHQLPSPLPCWSLPRWTSATYSASFPSPPWTPGPCTWSGRPSSRPPVFAHQTIVDARRQYTRPLLPAAGKSL